MIRQVFEPRMLLLGSGEFGAWAEPAERFALERADGDGSVVVLATAAGRETDSVYQGWLDLGLTHYTAIGVAATALPVRRRDDAMQPELARTVESASMVFFSGGSPRYLAACLRSTPLWDAVLAALARGAVFGSCSAGAMLAGAAAGASNGRIPAFPFSSGLGLCPDTVFGVHWDALDRLWLRPIRRAMVARVPPGYRLIGIAEDTAITTDGDRWRVFGAGVVEVRQGRERRWFPAGQTFSVSSH